MRSPSAARDEARRPAMLAAAARDHVAVLRHTVLDALEGLEAHGPGRGARCASPRDGALDRDCNRRAGRLLSRHLEAAVLYFALVPDLVTEALKHLSCL